MTNFQKVLLYISIGLNLVFFVLIILYFSTNWFSYNSISLHLPRVCDDYIQEGKQDDVMDRTCGIGE